MKLPRRSVLSGLVLTAIPAGTWAALKPDSKLNQSKALQAIVEKSIQAGGAIQLPAGDFIASGLRIDGALGISGVPGRTRIVSPDGRPALLIRDAPHVSLSGIIFDGSGRAAEAEDGRLALVMAERVSHLDVDGCEFTNSGIGGLMLFACSGRITGNRFSELGETALLARDSRGLEISGNRVSDIGDNGIQVWTSVPQEDGTVVSNNRIERIAARGGGTGQNGNGINVYKAGNVIVSGNRISDCAFSAIRNNSGSNCQIVNNSISRMGEVAIYCEFGFEGAIVSGNLIEDVGLGISITNFNEGGRLAVVANNLVRGAKGGGVIASTRGAGIAAEADTEVTGNVIEDAADVGIVLGWGAYCRNLAANGNLLRNCGTGIAFSLNPEAGPVMIRGNRIAGSKTAAIRGMDHLEPVTGDLGVPGAKMPAKGLVADNLVT